jgi:hypothetical protein
MGDAIGHTGKRTPIDEKEGYELIRVKNSDGSVEFLMTSPGDDPALRIVSKGKDALKEIMKHWKKVHTDFHNTWRNSHFKAIEAKVREIKARENDKQEKMFDQEGT